MCHSNGECSPGTCNCRGGKIERFIEPCILLLLKKNHPAHGYELLDKLSEYEINSDSGALYRTLRRLEDEKMVISAWETHGAGPAKRMYEITLSGETLLKNWIANFKKTKRTLDKFISEFNEIGSDN
ncbi:MAG: hypothetical protein APF76_08810 [Desulfitibacter sp. BRH_c19]|nr:MAG: hypothetical protein APF76_08810 [Desulfitibacter sp. BRH_c19]